VSVYRAYVLGVDGRVDAPPHFIACDDDEEALCEARQYVDGRAVEVWLDAKFIGRLEPE
jgi:hypothetical protein